MKILSNFKPLASGSCRITCARSLYQAPGFFSGLCRTDPVGPLYENPLGPLVSGSSITTFARSLYQDPFQPLVQNVFCDLCMRILLDHLHQNLVAPLVQDLCFRFFLITCISLFRISFGPLVSSLEEHSRVYFRILFDHFYDDPRGPLAEDLYMRILYDHLCKISVSGSLSFWTTCLRIL